MNANTNNNTDALIDALLTETNYDADDMTDLMTDVSEYTVPVIEDVEVPNWRVELHG